MHPYEGLIAAWGMDHSRLLRRQGPNESSPSSRDCDGDSEEEEEADVRGSEQTDECGRLSETNDARHQVPSGLMR